METEHQATEYVLFRDTFVHSQSTATTADAEYEIARDKPTIIATSADSTQMPDGENYWALLALILLFGTAGGNILVCLAIAWERRLQNVTNYFLMSLAITDLMVAVLVMPLGILILYKGYFPLNSEYCLLWICLDVLFCTASIMHLCTISVDRYLSLRYPMRFGRNKTRRRVILKISFVWVLSVAMSLPLSLMYSKEHASVLIDGTCQIPDPVYKLVGSIVCFYIPLGVMLLTYCLTIRLLDRQRQSLYGVSDGIATNGSSSGWLGPVHGLERRSTWRRLLKSNQTSTPNHPHSGTSTDTELSTLDTHELWLPESSISRPDPIPLTMGAIHRFGAEMLMFSHGAESLIDPSNKYETAQSMKVSFTSTNSLKAKSDVDHFQALTSRSNHLYMKTDKRFVRRASECLSTATSPPQCKPKSFSLPRNAFQHISKSVVPTCYDTHETDPLPTLRITESSSSTQNLASVPEVPPACSPAAQRQAKLNAIVGGSNSAVITWQTQPGTASLKTSFYLASGSVPRQGITFRRPATVRNHKTVNYHSTNSSSYKAKIQNVRPHHSRNSSVMTRNSSRHGRIIRLEQKATKVLGVVFFTFVILWAPFFILNLLPIICHDCEKDISNWVLDLVTWLGYGSSMVNPIFYTIFNNIFRQTFKKVLLCRYRGR